MEFLVIFQCMPRLKQPLRLPIPLLDRLYQCRLVARQIHRQVMMQDSFGFYLVTCLAFCRIMHEIEFFFFFFFLVSRRWVNDEIGFF